MARAAAAIATPMAAVRNFRLEREIIRMSVCARSMKPHTSIAACFLPFDRHRMSDPILLVIDGEQPLLDLVAHHGARAGFMVMTAPDTSSGLALLSGRRVDLVLVDAHLPGAGGLDILRRIREQAPDVQTVVMTALMSPAAAVDAVTRGATDCVSKPIDARHLVHVLQSVRAEIDRQRQVFSMESALARRLEFRGMTGRSAVMRDLFAQLRRLAPHARTTLITGEADTGKELAARALHDLGPRRKCRFVTVTARHASGALLDPGACGTMFFEEVGDLPPALQARLVRLIDPAGAPERGAPARPDVNVVAATSRDLREDVAAGRFRRDLFDLLRAVEVPMPALRDRRQDIPVLAAAFMRAFAERTSRPVEGITPRAEQLLLTADWAGNVRELRNSIERACIQIESGPITEREMRLALPRESGARFDTRPGTEPWRLAPEVWRPGADAAAPLQTLSRLERDHVLRALERARGNKKAAAEMLGVSRRAFYRRLERLSLGDVIARRPERPCAEPMRTPVSALV